MEKLLQGHDQTRYWVDLHEGCKGCRALSGRRSGRLAAISIAALFADLRAASNVGSMGAPKSYGSVDVGLDEGSTDIVCWR